MSLINAMFFLKLLKRKTRIRMWRAREYAEDKLHDFLSIFC